MESCIHRYKKMSRDTLGKEKKEAVKQHNSMTVFCEQTKISEYARVCINVVYAWDDNPTIFHFCELQRIRNRKEMWEKRKGRFPFLIL